MRAMLTIIAFVFSCSLYGQEYSASAPADANKIVSTFISIKAQDTLKNVLEKDLWTFELKFLNAANDTIWKADSCAALDYDSIRYLVKVDLPESVKNNTVTIWCSALLKKKPGDTTRQKLSYGGVNLSTIKLNITSSPQGAETFLIPNRIWSSKFQGRQWKDIANLLPDYRVNPTFTNTYVFVDETVYAVVCKLGTKFSMIRHNTQPVTVAKEQNVIVPFSQ